MKSIAITGSIASGKSFILKILNKMGFKVFSCDNYVKQLYLDLNVQQDLISLIDKLTIFDKKNLAQIIYSDDEQRSKLESYIYPKVIEGINNFKDQYSDEKFLFIEVPLLFEAGFNIYFDYSICAYCTEKTRKKRVVRRGNFDFKIYEKIGKIQLPQKEKRKLADFQMNTEGLAGIKKQINKMIDKLNE